MSGSWSRAFRPAKSSFLGRVLAQALQLTLQPKCPTWLALFFIRPSSQVCSHAPQGCHSITYGQIKATLQSEIRDMHPMMGLWHAQRSLPVETRSVT